MPSKTYNANEIHNPVAIFDKELLSDTTFNPQAFELCTICGARFGIGYHGACENGLQTTDYIEELPRKLTEILVKDHRQNRAHKRLIDLDF